MNPRRNPRRNFRFVKNFPRIKSQKFFNDNFQSNTFKKDKSSINHKYSLKKKSHKFQIYIYNSLNMNLEINLNPIYPKRVK